MGLLLGRESVTMAMLQWNPESCPYNRLLYDFGADRLGTDRLVRGIALCSHVAIELRIRESYHNNGLHYCLLFNIFAEHKHVQAALSMAT